MLARALLALSILVTPSIATPQNISWSNVVDQPNLKIDIDQNSINLIIRNGGFEMLSKLKMSFGSPIVVPGKSKQGAYYINDVAAKCKEDVIMVEKSTVFAADGEVLAAGKDTVVLKNPKNPQSFITVWLQLACGQLKGKRPPTII